MDKSQAKDLFQVQAEMIDLKVEVSVSKAIDRVIEKIDNLKSEIHELKEEMNTRFSSLEHRMIVVETKLGIINETRQALREKFMDYSFKAGWLLLGGAVSTLLYVTAQLIK